MQSKADKNRFFKVAAETFILFVILLQPVFADTFRIDVEVYPSTRADTVNLTFGAIEGATDGYDTGIDEVMPPPPPGRTYAYFWVDDPPTGQYRVDMRSSDAETLLYRFVATNGIPYYTIRWNHYAFPADGEFLIGAERTDTALVDDWFDMRTADSLAFLVFGDILYIAPSAVRETIKPDELSVRAYPNPASDFCNIAVDIPRRVEKGEAVPAFWVEIYGIDGHLISRTARTSFPIRYDTTTLKNGVYLVKVTTEDRVGSIPVLIVR